MLALPDRYPGHLPEPFHGVSHYGGRYEHTRYFHDLLTRYLLERGPTVDVFSPLAPLGEMGVLRVLAQGFPGSLPLWMPCPNPKVTTRKVSPCGDCESCRRAAAQLISVDSDPARVGLGPDALKSLFREGLTSKENDPETVEEVRVRLARLGWNVRNGDAGAEPPVSFRREVERLRFDNRMTFIDHDPQAPSRALLPSPPRLHSRCPGVDRRRVDRLRSALLEGDAARESTVRAVARERRVGSM
ncbi:MAG: hypothetical protein IPK07_21035 [Deltaproteobacteria bacterium]|nr:hypothetical protein [Deltaproteobacteria bacterium]